MIKSLSLEGASFQRLFIHLTRELLVPHGPYNLYKYEQLRRTQYERSPGSHARANQEEQQRGRLARPEPEGVAVQWAMPHGRVESRPDDPLAGVQSRAERFRFEQTDELLAAAPSVDDATGAEPRGSDEAMPNEAIHIPREERGTRKFHHCDSPSYDSGIILSI